MLSHLIKIAFRNLIKHRLYSLINIAGLALGLAVFIFNSILVAYEAGHDSMFTHRDRIFVVGSIAAPTENEAVREIPRVPTAYGPLFDLEIKDAEQVARLIYARYVMTGKNSRFYGGIRFVEAGFTRIFDFQYIHGGPTAIDDPFGLIVTKSTAMKLFGRTDVMGEVVTLDHKHPLRITAVIEDVPKQSHFSPLISPPPNDFTAITAYKTLAILNANFEVEGNWIGFGTERSATYILLPEKHDRAWLQDQVDAVYARHTPEYKREHIRGLKVKPLAEARNWLLETWGLPVIDSIQLLSLLVLMMAGINYINLATAQNFGRTREVGLRKTLGAGRSHLLVQFLVESQLISAFAMVLALACIELLLPRYNEWSGRTMALDYSITLPWLILGTVTVGLLSGAYPAYLISRLSPIDSLRNTLLKGHKGSIFRGFMIAAQFSISVFILAMVMVVYFQNLKLRELGNAFPKGSMVILYDIYNPGIRDKHEALRRELETLTNIQTVTFSSSLPFDQGTWDLKVTPNQGDESAGFMVDMIAVDFDYLEAYDIKLLAGRSFSPDIALDIRREGREQLNVMVNRLAAEMLGFLNAGDSAENALGKSFHRITDENDPQPEQFTIAGIVENLNFNGFFNKTKPMIFFIEPEYHRLASIRIGEQNHRETISDIEGAWKRVIGDHPIQYNFLNDVFNRYYRIFKSIQNTLAIFAGVAFLLALTGLVSLSAFMAPLRIKEIVIRKVMGADEGQIVRLLIWQFSLPVIWSLPLAIPLSYLSSRLYLEFFAERINFILPAILLASILSILMAWGIVAGHAINAARKRPACSLRYE